MGTRIGVNLAAIADPDEQAQALIDYLAGPHEPVPPNAARRYGTNGVRAFREFVRLRVKRGHEPGIAVLGREFFSLYGKRVRVAPPDRVCCRSRLAGARRPRRRGAGRPARRGSRCTRAGPDSDDPEPANGPATDTSRGAA